MDENRIKEILANINNVNIAVYGDFCLDAYWIMDERHSEVSIETGLQAEAIERHYYTPGGAANVVANLSALKPGNIRVIGAVGDDIHGRELTAQLTRLGANTECLVIQKENFNTYTYLKRYADGKELPRMDFGVYNQRSAETDAKILESIRKSLEDCDALIFNQQVAGSINNETFMEKANQLFAKFTDKIVVLDSRHFNNRFSNVYRKTNEKEIAALCGTQVDPRETIPTSDVKKYGTMVFRRESKPLFVTCGARGMLVFDSTGVHEIPGIQLTAKLDTVGAGDTVISALTACLAAGISPTEAGEFANLAASVTVQKLFTTGTASGEEISKAGRDPNFVYRFRPGRKPKGRRIL